MVHNTCVGEKCFNYNVILSKNGITLLIRKHIKVTNHNNFLQHLYFIYFDGSIYSKWFDYIVKSPFPGIFREIFRVVLEKKNKTKYFITYFETLRVRVIDFSSENSHVQGISIKSLKLFSEHTKTHTRLSHYKMLHLCFLFNKLGLLNLHCTLYASMTLRI